MAIAFELAYVHHQGQKYGEEEYIEHLRRVKDKAEFLYSNSPCYDRVVIEFVSWLHDILEDTECTEDMIQKALKGITVDTGGFIFEIVDDVVSAVVSITKVDGETRLEYLARCSGNSYAWKVKVADTLSNLECSVKSGEINRIDKYTKQLQRLYALGDANSIPVHSVDMDAIHKKPVKKEKL